MPISAKCTCGKQYRVRDKFLGQRARCPACRQVFYVCEHMLASYSYLKGEEVPAAELIDAETGQPAACMEPSEVPGAAEPACPKLQPVQPGRRSLRDYVYWILLLCLFLLALFLGKDPGDTFDRRLERTLRDAPQEIKERAYRIYHSDYGTLDQLLEELPSHRLAGSYLPRETNAHYVYAAATTIVFLGLMVLMFRPGSARLHHLLLIAFLTGTVGIGILIIVYDMGGSLLALAADDPNSDFGVSLIAFIAGVGIFEEVCKALPLVWFLSQGWRLEWRTAFLWGFASGIGFGVSEGIAYSAEFYNGVETWEIYPVRFGSCVALHAIWSATSGLMLFRWQAVFQRSNYEWYDRAGIVLLAVAIPAVLHGFYDAFLKVEIYLGALLTSLVSFALLAWLVEDLRRNEATHAVAEDVEAGIA